MTLEEIERELRDPMTGMSQGYARRLADAIKAHRERCVDAGKVRSAYRDTDGICPDCRGLRDRIEAILPPQKSALQRAIEMVEADHETRRDRTGFSNTWHESLLTLLLEAEKEAK